MHCVNENENENENVKEHSMNQKKTLPKENYHYKKTIIISKNKSNTTRWAKKILKHIWRAFQAFVNTDAIIMGDREESLIDEMVGFRLHL